MIRFTFSSFSTWRPISRATVIAWLTYPERWSTLAPTNTLHYILDSAEMYIQKSLLVREESKEPRDTYDSGLCVLIGGLRKLIGGLRENSNIWWMHWMCCAGYIQWLKMFFAMSAQVKLLSWGDSISICRRCCAGCDYWTTVVGGVAV